MISDLARAIDQIVKEKGISRDVLIDASEKSILAAARKMLGPTIDVEVQFNESLGEVELFEFKTVVEELEDHECEISLAEALELDPGAEEGDSLGVKMDLEGFGRIAAQTAKQVLLQHVRDAEREYIYDEYKDRKEELITGMVRRFEKGALIVDLGKTEAMLPPRECVPGESYRPGDRIQAYVLDVLRTTRGSQIILSRTHPGLIRRLFEMEVPEIFEGIVRIEAVAREPGFRAKIAVASRDSDVDPVGACVGMKGSRVQAVVQELRGEKIDIIPWSIDPAKFVCNAISPAAVNKVIIDEETRSMELVVPDDQLSLAIGRRGQNVRLAAQLTGWRIDIISETKIQEMNARARDELQRIDGLSDTLVEILVRHGYRATGDVAHAENDELVDFLGIDEERAEKIIDGARSLLEREDLETLGTVEPIRPPKPEPEEAEEEIATASDEASDASASDETSEGSASDEASDGSTSDEASAGPIAEGAGNSDKVPADASDGATGGAGETVEDAGEVQLEDTAEGDEASDKGKSRGDTPTTDAVLESSSAVDSDVPPTPVTEGGIAQEEVDAQA